jgi:hypothetical protein
VRFWFVINIFGLRLWFINNHKWARLLSQQTSITVHRSRPRKNNLLFSAENKRMFAVSVFGLQQTNGSCR